MYIIYAVRELLLVYFLNVHILLYSNISSKDANFLKRKISLIVCIFIVRFESHATRILQTWPQTRSRLSAPSQRIDRSTVHVAIRRVYLSEDRSPLRGTPYRAQIAAMSAVQSTHQ